MQMGFLVVSGVSPDRFANMIANIKTEQGQQRHAKNV